MTPPDTATITPSSATTIAGAVESKPVSMDVHDWYKDALIYQLHIKAFQDSNDDGIGDFAGLLQRLDYVAELGVTAIWVLPFYPSPLRDDGYDIADYTSINPSYGTMEDFKRFVEAAHARGLRVITELVINHTSDQHPWFQRARRAPPGSVERDFYVWSDTDEKWPETRIIFTDTEKSNWAWDEEAEAYYWHRFFSHQPDLNFDNPAVLAEVLKAMRFWLDLGVDGLRLDAIPYLVERDGTINENLPETHEVLKRIRAEVDAHYTGKMLLAEANQWPEDTRPYFGDGDECHMGFHFPLMPRMYMALAQEDRHPITDILRQTPPIPDNCQWAIFLRNHDELTLEMVTDEERDYMWSFYASDRRARINLGIRRRLAPLLDNDRRKIELLNGMLFSMPGTPVVYYGDEIGMGDNYYLGDRDGVRTPMQWSADRNAGFSRANPQQLYLPTIQDPVYGYQAVNVEAQTTTANSLLNWMKRMIRIRKRQPAFGRGALDFLYPRNRRVLAYLRSYEDEVLLCVFNVSRQAQAVELDLGQFKGRVPVELDGGTAFPPIGDLPYLLTLPPYGFYWFQLAKAERLPDWHSPHQEILPDFITLPSRSLKITHVLSEENRALLAEAALPEFLPLQRWYGAKGEQIRKIEIAPGPVLAKEFSLTTITVDTSKSGEQRYFLPLKPLWGSEHIRFGAATLGATLARIRRTNRLGALIDASHEASLAEVLVNAMREHLQISESGGSFHAESTPEIAALEGVDKARALGGEQSNISIAFGDKGVLKIYRRLRAGQQPEIEVARFLTEIAGYRNTPSLLGEATLVEEGSAPATVAACFAFVPNQGDGFHAMVDALLREIDEHASAKEGPDATVPAGEVAYVASEAEEAHEEPDSFPYPLNLTRLLGQRTGELHVAFATPTDDPSFAIEKVTAEDIANWAADTRAQAKDAFRRIEVSHGDNEFAAALLARREEAFSLIDRLGQIAPKGMKSRIHGDFHLGQVLVSQGDFYLIDFEGEPRRPLEERRAKGSPLRDVAGILRSFDYVAIAALDRAHALDGLTEEAVARTWEWRDLAAARFMEGYREATEGLSTLPENWGEVLRLLTLQKAFYEIGYEAANRPAWLSIPIRGVLALMDQES